MLRHLVRSGRRSLLTAPIVHRRPNSAGNVGLLDDLSYRGFIQDVTTPQFLHDALEFGPQTVYAGIDPTAGALHVGHLLPLMCLLHFQVRGHQIIPLIGGATGLIGDPSGRSTEREPAETEQIEKNTVALSQSVELFFKRAFIYADDRIVLDKGTYPDVRAKNNIEWHKNMTMMDFLRNVGVHSRINTMLNKESVRTRLESKHGISFTEFSYQLLQAYDFYHLHKHFGCNIQVGGSDQWGNILGGIALINRIDAQDRGGIASVFGLTTPLLTSASGVKFGKTAGNAVWLDPQMTSVFNFYQYFVKTTDAEVESFLKLLTLMSWSEIHTTMEAHMAQPNQRIAQRRLAAEVTELIHLSGCIAVSPALPHRGSSESGRMKAETVTKIMFDADLADLRAQAIIDAFQDDPCLHMVDQEELATASVVKLAVKYGIVSSASAARLLVLSRGLYQNNRPVAEIQFTLQHHHLVDDRVAILRAGKDKMVVLVAKSS
ncbi:hypothetical protein B0H10DRAFT_1782616 [Mycena sp. CBHHK59/15]|nr:hypothetical protein B0H10DRAFT_1782616 [Mycena sp. CBHHK59/15]